MTKQDTNFEVLEISNVIAERRFLTEDGNCIILRIGKPVAGVEDYYCPWQILGSGESEIRKIYGLDSLQSLILALEVIHVYFSEFIEEKLSKSVDNDLCLLPRNLS